MAIGLLLVTAGPAHAGYTTGMNGDQFNPQKWSLLNSNIGTPLGYQASPSNYLYICGATPEQYQVGCINNSATAEGQNPPDPISLANQYTVTDPMQQSGNLFLIGSDIDSYSGGGTAGSTSTTNFSVTNTSGYNYNLNFNVTFYGFCDGNGTVQDPCPNTYSNSPTFNVLASGQVSPLLTYTGASYSQQLSVYLLAGSTLTYQIVSANNSSTMTPSLVVSGFSYEKEVPAPLPALGAAAAFAYSRRLRRRLRAVRPDIPMDTPISSAILPH